MWTEESVYRLRPSVPVMPGYFGRIIASGSFRYAHNCFVVCGNVELTTTIERIVNALNTNSYLKIMT